MSEGMSIDGEVSGEVSEMLGGTRGGKVVQDATDPHPRLVMMIPTTIEGVTGDIESAGGRLLLSGMTKTRQRKVSGSTVGDDTHALGVPILVHCHRVTAVNSSRREDTDDIIH